ncbi:MAG: winged helix-turn-helix domain-containing protein, partial [Gammaproteobacteria bacterium]
ARVTFAGRPVTLTAYEFRTLDYLLRHRDKVVSKTELTEHIYEHDFELDSNVIEVLINRLRGKLDPSYIVTRRGLGYQFVDPGDA